jgi:hypothetical protein
MVSDATAHRGGTRAGTYQGVVGGVQAGHVGVRDDVLQELAQVRDVRRDRHLQHQHNTGQLTNVQQIYIIQVPQKGP